MNNGRVDVNRIDPVRRGEPSLGDRELGNIFVSIWVDFDDEAGVIGSVAG